MPAYVQKKRHPAEHGLQRQLPGPYRDNKLLRVLQRDLLYLKGLAGWNFPYELVGDPGHYNSRCIKAKRKGLPPVLRRQQALPLLGQDGLDVMEQRFLVLWTLTPVRSISL